MKGIVPSLNTPFDKDGDVDEDSLRRLVNHTIDAGCGGMLGLAVAGEFSTLSQAEKTRFIEVVAEANDRRIPFIVSVTSPDPSASIALAKSAKIAGATGICVQLPDGSGRQRKLEYLQDLAQHGPDLLMVQDLDWTGGGLPLEEIVTLFEKVDQFSWLKIETQQAGPKYSEVLQATDCALKVCGGWAVTQLMDAMARGVNAFIPTGMEQVYVAIHRYYANGNLAAARSLFDRVLPVLNFSNQHIDISIQFFKELRKAEGLFDTNVCRVLSSSFDEYQRHEAEQAIDVALKLIREMKS